MIKGQENLIPITSETAAELGAKGGRAKKGSRHLSNLIRELAENIDWDLTTLKDKESLKKQYGKQGWKAVVYVAFTKSMAGDVKAMEWLAKHGYGQKIDLTSDGNPIQVIIAKEYSGEPKFRTDTLSEPDDLAEESS